MRALGLIIGLSLANFAYQALHDRRWDVALERTWFQAVAIALYAFVT